MEVGIVTVGDELLAGDTVNTNATWLCRQLAERGVEVRRVVVVPDAVDEIAAEVATQRDSWDAVIVTGGLGPTHDDVTMDAIAKALDRSLVEHSDAKQWLAEKGGYSAEELVDGTVDLPAGADPIHNEVGVAPGAKVEGVYVFPGVPAEMQSMFEAVAADFVGKRRTRRTVRIDEPESHLLDRFEALRKRFDVAVGSYPGETVDVTISGFDPEEVEEAADWLAARAETISTKERPDPGERDQETES